MVFVPVCHPSGLHWVSVVLWKDMKEEKHPYRVMVLNSMQAYRKHDAKLARAMVRCCVESGYKQEGIWTCWYDVTAEYPIPLEQRPRNLCGVHVICHAFQAATNQLDKKLTFETVDLVREYAIYNIYTKNTELCKLVTGWETCETQDSLYCATV